MSTRLLNFQIILLLALVLISGCSQSKFMVAYQKKLLPPPGTVQIGPNLFLDKFELSNIHYHEFLHYQGRAYGLDSEEYMNVLPKTTIWYELNPAYSYLDTVYQKPGEFDDYPLVGVSYEQAKKYSKWRADRVFQAYLTINDVIPFHKSYHKDSLFTIEKYYTGNYLGMKPDPKFPHYPEYSLPDSNSYLLALQYIDSNQLKHRDGKLISECCKEILYENNCISTDKNIDAELPFGALPTKLSYCLDCKDLPYIFRLNDNVREKTVYKNVLFGKCFANNCNTEIKFKEVELNLPNAFTGFRNICQYKVWKESTNP